MHLIHTHVYLDIHRCPLEAIMWNYGFQCPSCQLVSLHIIIILDSQLVCLVKMLVGSDSDILRADENFESLGCY